MKLLSENESLQRREQLVTWIAEGDGPVGRLARLAIVIGGVFALGYAAGGGARTWWIAPAVLSLGLSGLFALWRVIEWRRRVERRKNPPVRTFDLPSDRPD